MLGDKLENPVEGFDIKEILEAEAEQQKKKKRRKGKDLVSAVQDNFEIDVKDERFAALYDNNRFAIDKTDPKFKHTKNMQKLLDSVHSSHTNQSEKQQNKDDKTNNNNEKNNSNEIAALVNRVKGLQKVWNKPNETTKPQPFSVSEKIKTSSEVKNSSSSSKKEGKKSK
eukprot:c14399_g1_i1.p1 GENE.c14399_g1_i1~~c14399_g1_i1.p1  ORF type:complete len:193 (-),score=91.16 c14399_g1_i1:6-512(-)